MPNPLGISKSVPNLFTSTIGKTITEDVSSKISKTISSGSLEKFAKKAVVNLADKAMDSMLEDLIDSTPSSDFNINVPAPSDMEKHTRTVALQSIMRDVEQLSTASSSERKVLLDRLGQSFLKLNLNMSNDSDLEFLNDILKHPSIQGLSDNDRLGLAMAILKVGIAHSDIFAGLTTDKYEQEALENAQTVERIFDIIEDIETLKGEIEAIIDLYDEGNFDDTPEMQTYRSEIPSTLLEQLQEAKGKPDDALIEKIIDAILDRIEDSSVRDQLADLFMNYILEYRSDDIREMEQMQDTLDGKSDSVSLKSKSTPTPTIKSGSSGGKGSTPDV